MRFALTLFSIGLMQTGAQTRTDLAARYGPPHSEIFLLPQGIKLTAALDTSGGICALRIETPDHSERVAPNITDDRFWMSSSVVADLIKELVPEQARSGEPRSRTVGLRVGEHLRVDTWDAVEITRIQRSRRLLSTAEESSPGERLARIIFRRPECASR